MRQAETSQTERPHPGPLPPQAGEGESGALHVFLVFLRLGLTSFGGPVAHLGFFRAAFVERRRWLSDAAYADLVALCQFLPGPASSQVGMAIGLGRAGLPGALAAWLGFTLPSAVLLVAFAYGLGWLDGALGSGWLHGLKLAAVAVVAQAVWAMGKGLCPDRPRQSLAILAAAVALAWPTVWGQLAVLALGAGAGWALYRGEAAKAGEALAAPVPRWLALACLALFGLLLVLLPLLARESGSQAVAYADSFYRAGSLVFGGGHVVLPLLQAEVVAPGWVAPDAFLAGYGAAQAVPGPLFTFAAYLGAVMGPAPNGWQGALLCLGAIFLPSFLLVVGALPFWSALRARPGAQALLRGVNAAVVGLLLAAFWNPVVTVAVLTSLDAALALLLFALLALWKWPPWLVVALGALGGAGLAGAGLAAL